MNLINDIDDLHEELEAKGMVRACPICFKLVLLTCFHEEMIVNTVEMTEEERKAKRYKWLDDEITELAERLLKYIHEFGDLKPTFEVYDEETSPLIEEANEHAGDASWPHCPTCHERPLPRGWQECDVCGSTPRATVTTSAAPLPKSPCRHDSARLDGWLDNCCMNCGADGYWESGQQITDPTDRDSFSHPSGKTLLSSLPEEEKRMHPATEAILKHFTYTHLPEELQDISKPICDLAHDYAKGPQNAELTAGLRKLLEAKDCFVRAAIDDHH